MTFARKFFPYCFCLLLAVVFTGTVSFAEIRYVKAGSPNSVPPYTSWTTASDSIQKCIDICSYGDTIYIAPGVYKEKLMVKAGLALIGSGMDTTIIDTREIATPTGFLAVTLIGNATLSNFTIIVSNGSSGTGVYLIIGTQLKYIDLISLKIINAFYGIAHTNSSGVVKDCIILNTEFGIDLINTIYSDVIMENNLIESFSRCIAIEPSASTITIRNNILNVQTPFGAGYFAFYVQSCSLSNNLIISKDDLAFEGISPSRTPHFINNNVTIGKFRGSASTGQGAIGAGDQNIVLNNAVIGSNYGIINYPGDNPIIKHNNSWNNVHNYYNFTPDSTNISADPMFVNPDSLDFRLQKFSPMIDAGDPEINDLDGSRSDIGLLGGPYGGFYEYIDLAPKIPKGFTAELLPKNILLRWNKNTEFDFSYYTIYRDTVSDSFTPDSSNLLGTIRDTLFIDNTLISSSAVYYKITAVDLAGNQSPASPAASVITGMDGATAEVSNPDYRLYPNYPNPFNPSTTITYTLEKGGLVQLMVYDIQGQLVDVLVNKVQEAGVHKVIYTIKNTDVPSGILMIRIQVKDDLNRMIYSEVIKALIIK